MIDDLILSQIAEQIVSQSPPGSGVDYSTVITFEFSPADPSNGMPCQYSMTEQQLNESLAKLTVAEIGQMIAHNFKSGV